MFDIAMTLEGYIVDDYFDDYASEGIRDIGRAIGGRISGAIQRVKEWFNGLWGKIKNTIKSLLSPTARAIKKEDKIRNRAAVDFIEKVLPNTTKTVEQGFAKLTGAKSNRQMLDRWGSIEPKIKNAVDSAKDAYSKVNTSMNENIFSARTSAKLLTKIEANKSSIDRIIATAEQCIRETSQQIPNKFKVGKGGAAHRDEQAPAEGGGEVGASIGSKLVPMITALQPLYTAAIRILRTNDYIHKFEKADKAYDKNVRKSEKAAAKEAKRAARRGGSEDSPEEASTDSWYF